METALLHARSEINITPYIDILLVLLIIFMVIQPSAQYNLGARVPQNQQQKAEHPSPAIVLSIQQDLSLQINQEPVALKNLGSRLFQIFSARPDKRMFLHAATELPFGTVARIIDIAKGSGVGDIGLMTS
jgi:biopolymer transport protein ExbD